MRVASPGKQGARHEVLARPFVKLRLNKPRPYKEKRTAGWLHRLRGEFTGGGGEVFCVQVDVGFAGGGTHQRHVVERREEHAAVERVEMEETLEFEIGGSSGFAAIARRFLAKRVFSAAAEAGDVPGERCGANVFRDAIVEALGERNHVFECGGRKNVFERGAHRCQRERVAAKVPPMPPTSQSSSWMWAEMR